MQRIAAPSSDISYGPTFSHALKDPLPTRLALLPERRIVLVEGLYVTLAIEPWKNVATLLDERWLISVDEDTVRRGIIKTHLKTGVAPTVEEAVWRSDSSDIPSE